MLTVMPPTMAGGMGGDGGDVVVGINILRTRARAIVNPPGGGVPHTTQTWACMPSRPACGTLPSWRADGNLLP